MLARLVAGREKDYELADALIDRGLIDPKVLLERVDGLPVVGAIKRRIRTFIVRRFVQRRVDDT